MMTEVHLLGGDATDNRPTTVSLAVTGSTSEHVHSVALAAAAVVVVVAWSLK
jgi:hypothetical protein